MPELVRAFGIGRTTVLAHLERQGVPRRCAVRKLPDEQEAEAIRRYMAGDSASTVAKHFVVDATTILRTLKRHGVAARPAAGAKAS